MNGAPHVHNIEINRRWSDNTGNWLVRYGDTKVRIAFFFEHPDRWAAWHKKWIIAGAIRRAVRRHDKASQRIDRSLKFRASAVADLGLFSKPADGWNGVWASDHFKRVK